MQEQLISEVPDWIPQDAWEGWLQMRKQKRIPTTQRAKNLAIATLGRMRALGEPIEHVLGQSEFKGWSGLFPVADDYYQMLGIDRTKQRESAVILKLKDRSWAQ